MKLVTKSAIAALLVGATTTTGLAMADVEDARALADAKISLVEAITAAESHTNGKAYEAQIEDDAFESEFEVNVVAGQKVYEVRVDGQTGEVISSREDRDD